jgi:sporulation protein YlmC with PRC-barrel domain
MEYLEAHVEHLLGRRIVDVDGHVVGRLEEMNAEIVDGEMVVTEFHIGTAALVERVGAFVTQLPFFRHIPFSRHGYRVPWQQLDLSDTLHPRVRVRRDELERMDLWTSVGQHQ